MKRSREAVVSRDWGGGPSGSTGPDGLFRFEMKLPKRFPLNVSERAIRKRLLCRAVRDHAQREASARPREPGEPRALYGPVRDNQGTKRKQWLGCCQGNPA